ncbi:MAG TPA: response regulator transcription factor [Chitinophagaceae bacterium]|nr:response regulator transcription factor [Chitinophagaceae bacterium]
MKKDRIRIALLDDHQIVLDGLCLLLEDQEQLELVHSDTSSQRMMDWLLNHSVDILLSDIMMPEMDGYELACKVKKELPGIKIIALSMNGEPELVHRMIDEAGVEGFVLKTCGQAELLKAIDQVSLGKTYYAGEISLARRAYQQHMEEDQAILLTPREIEVIRCISKEMTNRQIADTLFISERTVETHRKNIFRKTGVHSIIGLLDLARSKHWI